MRKWKGRIPGLVITLVMAVVVAAFIAVLTWTQFIPVHLLVPAGVALVMLATAAALLVRNTAFKVQFVLGTLLALILTAVLAVGGYYLYRTTSTLSRISETRTQSTPVAEQTLERAPVRVRARGDHRVREHLPVRAEQFRVAAERLRHERAVPEVAVARREVPARGKADQKDPVGVAAVLHARFAHVAHGERDLEQRRREARRRDGIPHDDRVHAGGVQPHRDRLGLAVARKGVAAARADDDRRALVDRHLRGKVEEVGVHSSRRRGARDVQPDFFMCHGNHHSLFFFPVGEADCRFAFRGKGTSRVRKSIFRTKLLLVLLAVFQYTSTFLFVQSLLKITTGLSRRSGKVPLLHVYLWNFQAEITCRSISSAGLRKPCRDGPRRGPSRGRCRGSRRGSQPSRASQGRTCRR